MITISVDLGSIRLMQQLAGYPLRPVFETDEPYLIFAP